jgi:restriction endonuclease S subunit
MPKLNRETLFAFPTPLPPYPLQEAFDDRLTSIESIIAQAERALPVACELERVLMARLLE